MKKIELYNALLTLNGLALKIEETTLTVGLALSNIVLSAKVKHFDVAKTYVLSKRFYTEESIEFDDADMEKLRKTISECEIYNPLVSGQLLIILKD